MYSILGARAAALFGRVDLNGSGLLSLDSSMILVSLSLCCAFLDFVRGVFTRDFLLLRSSLSGSESSITSQLGVTIRIGV